jgi:hypothetical protein
MPTDTMEHLLRYALRHLYDSEALRTSPLVLFPRNPRTYSVHYSSARQRVRGFL